MPECHSILQNPLASSAPPVSMEVTDPSSGSVGSSFIQNAAADDDVDDVTET